MEAFHYVDIFATKGIEYLLIIAFFGAIVPVWIWSQRTAVPEPAGAASWLSELGAAVGGLMQKPLAPEGFLFSDQHSWVRQVGDFRMQLGVDSLVTGALGDLEAVQVRSVGEMLRQGDPLIALRLRGRELVIPAPMSGEVVEINEAALLNPRSIVAEPYSAGLVTMRTRDPAVALAPLRAGERAAQWLDGEFRRLVDFLASSGGGAATYADGAYPAAGALGQVDDRVWGAFAAQFLTPERAEADDPQGGPWS